MALFAFLPKEVLFNFSGECACGASVTAFAAKIPRYMSSAIEAQEDRLLKQSASVAAFVTSVPGMIRWAACRCQNTSYAPLKKFLERTY